MYVLTTVPDEIVQLVQVSFQVTTTNQDYGHEIAGSMYSTIDKMNFTD